MNGIIIADPNKCPTSTNITSIVLSSTGPWGLNTITGVLTVPDSALHFNNQPTWNFDATGQVMELQFNRFDGTSIQLPARLSPTSSSTDRSNSFENNGVGIEFIHSDETGGVRPANPNLIVNSSGVAGRKYPAHQNYIWIDNDVGRPTHWWRPASSSWWRIRPLRNTLTVGPDASFDFQTLNAAFAYINGLPASPVALDPNQDARQSATNTWTVILWGRTEITASLEILDFVNVLFMPGAQIVDSPTSWPGGRMLTLSQFDPIRSPTVGTGGRKFRATWTAVSPYFGSSANEALYNIVHKSGPSGVDVAAIFISGMWSASISNLSIYVASNSFSSSSLSGIRVEGDLLEGTGQWIRQGVHLNRINVCCEPSAFGVTTGFWLNHDEGTVYMSDCQGAFTTVSATGITAGIYCNGSGSSNVEMEECRFDSATNVGTSNFTYGLFIPSTSVTSGTVTALRCEFKAYGSTANGSRARAVSIEGARFQATYCLMEIVQHTGAGPSAVKSSAVFYNATGGQSMVLDQCTVLAWYENSDAMTLTNMSNAVSAEVRVNQCTIIGGAGVEYALSLLSQTLTNANFYGNVILGVIASVAFTPNAATTTFNTTYRV